MTTAKGTELAEMDRSEMALDPYRFEVTAVDARRQLQAIREFQAVVTAEMIEGQDYGTIPGTDKPTLLKPGAEKLAKLLMCSDQYEIIDKREDWEKGFFYYHIKCRLISIAHGILVSEGMGSANSRESKWRWRWVWPDKVPEHMDKKLLEKRTGKSKRGHPYTMYRVENDDPYSLVNTIQKMAAKRALVAAALSAGRLSNIFTQDMEDVDIAETASEEEAGERPQDPQRKKQSPNGTVRMASEDQIAAMEEIAAQSGMDRAAWLDTLSNIVDREENVASIAELTYVEAVKVLNLGEKIRGDKPKGRRKEVVDLDSLVENLAAKMDVPADQLMAFSATYGDYDEMIEEFGKATNVKTIRAQVAKKFKAWADSQAEMEKEGEDDAGKE